MLPDVDLGPMQMKEKLMKDDKHIENSVLSRLVIRNLFTEKKYRACADLAAASVGWYFDDSVAQREEAERVYDRMLPGITRLGLENGGNAVKNQVPKDKLVDIVRAKMPPTWTFVMICRIPGNLADYSLMHNGYAADKNRLETGLIIRINKTGPILMTPLKKAPSVSACPVHDKKDVTPTGYLKNCNDCFRPGADCTRILSKLVQTKKTENFSDGGYTHGQTQLLLEKFRSDWLDDSCGPMLMGVLVEEEGTLSPCEALKEEIVKYLKQFFASEWTKDQLCDEAISSIAHFFVELELAGCPYRKFGFEDAVADVLLTYHRESFSDLQRGAGPSVSAVIKIVDALRKKWGTTSLDSKNLKRGPVILILDKEFVSYPWETTPVLFGRPISRIPSLHFAASRLTEGFVKGRYVGPRLNPKKLFYLVDPEKNLPKTKDRMAFIAESDPNWRGFVCAVPSNEESANVLKNVEVYVYIGHGGGHQYLKSLLSKLPSANGLFMLFGCASATTAPEGPFVESSGLPSHLLEMGACGVMGMLHTVTDKDCDAATLFLFEDFFGVKNGKVLGECPPKGVDLIDSVAKCRAVCQRAYNQISPVFYGLPDVKLKWK